ncbi:MAG: hypothetical protein LJE96_02245 [Deltaproteobacteria bacterium]|nr:hypothetical protein [Deltaproteobacteria bacterium]
MKNTLLAFLLIFAVAGTAIAGIPGATDKVPAASLIVPFFEVGINSGEYPIDTLLTVNNIVNLVAPMDDPPDDSHRIHYHVWDNYGNALELYGNEVLESAETWSVSMRALIESASSAVKSALTDGNFYRGFVTIDVVTADTTQNPTESGYPFASIGGSDILEGFIYYVRLAQGSSNSMDMIPLNLVTPGVDSALYDFYGSGSGDGRERIDSTARLCTEELIYYSAAPLSATAPIGPTCWPLTEIWQVDSRVFLNPALNAETRIILFLWDPKYLGGPSIYCDTRACPSLYGYQQFNESGSMLVDSTIRLDKVVNVINVSGSSNGWVSIQRIADPESGRQVFGFSFTKASPPSGASATWDAILESFITP